MPGLVPGIHVGPMAPKAESYSQPIHVDARDKPGHDDASEWRGSLPSPDAVMGTRVEGAKVGTVPPQFSGTVTNSCLPSPSETRNRAERLPALRRASICFSTSAGLATASWPTCTMT